MIEFKIELNANTIQDVMDALSHTIEQLEKGFTSGDLRNENIDSGSFEVTGEEVCPECGGSGEITVDEPVYNEPGSPTAPIGTRPCPRCKSKKTSDDEDDDSLGGSGSDSAPEGPDKNELNPKSLARSSSRDSRSSSDEDVVVKTEGEIKV